MRERISCGSVDALGNAELGASVVVPAVEWCSEDVVAELGASVVVPAVEWCSEDVDTAGA